MQDTILLTLGRLPKGLELAFAFKRAGCRVVIAEPWRWHLSRVSRAVDRSYAVTAPNTDVAAYHADLVDIAERERATLVVPVSEESMHVAGLAGSLPPATRLFSMPQAALIELHDKLDFVRKARSFGLPVPETFDVDSDAAKRLAATARYIVKPRLSSAGHGVEVHDAGDPLPPPAAPAIVQAHLPGEELSSFSIAHQGRVIGSVVYRGLIVSGSVSVCFAAVTDPDPAILQWIERFVGASDYSGFIAFDFRRDAAGDALPIECNPRTTSGIHFVHPADLAQAIRDPAAPNPFRLRSERVLQQFYPALTETQGAALKGRPWRGNLRYLFGCRDVSWAPRDPLPFLLMPLTSYQILRRTIFAGMSFGEAATFDIGWYRAT
ncbi:MAG: ATP-grasp domain-containing protein [Gammaproteobacteria bacterium]|nr:ATP-grasp domain-containing protein [Gammaproteobacteria bacterium]